MASNAVLSNEGVSSVTREEREEGGSSGGSGSDGGDTLEIVDLGDDGPRTHADPLPSKRGEIGYDEATHRQESPSSSSGSRTALPERHPADRDSPSESNSNTSSSSDDPASEPPADTSSTHSSSNRSLAKLLRPKRLPRLGGIRSSTLGLLIAQILLLVGTIVAWAFAIKKMPAAFAAQGGAVGFNTTQIFIHVTFAIATIMELVFLERTVFRVRAERYAFKYPGGILPSSRARHSTGGMTFGFAPWNRPPLPTYAAALAQTGHGTGDVEDNVIAVPPPPAYGNTRGSTLLLSGFISNTLRAQRVRDRVRDSRTTVRSSWRSEISLRSDRPVSYRSHDSSWEERMDAHRAMHLEDTLARLEDGPGSASRNNGRTGGSQ